MSISFNGFNNTAVTMSVTGTVTKGSPLVMSSSKTVTDASEGDDFIGVCSLVKNGMATVTLTGYVKLPYTGEITPCVGLCGLCADSSGGVTADEDAARLFLVLDVDTTAHTVGFIL